MYSVFYWLVTVYGHIASITGNNLFAAQTMQYSVISANRSPYLGSPVYALAQSLSPLLANIRCRISGQKPSSVSLFLLKQNYIWFGLRRYIITII
jgi:hypothetical protein